MPTTSTEIITEEEEYLFFSHIFVKRSPTVEDVKAELSLQSNRKSQSGVDYIQYEGNIHHIARFLSIQEGRHIILQHAVGTLEISKLFEIARKACQYLLHREI